MTIPQRFLTVFVLLGLLGAYLTLHEDIAMPTKLPFSEFPTVVKEWQMTSQSEFSDNVLKVLKASDYISRNYKGVEDASVGLYIGFHSGGKGSGGIHSPKHCLPGSGWYEASSKREQLVVGNVVLNVVRAVYQKGERKEMFVYWFQVRDRSVSDEYALKVAEITNSLLYRRRDSTFVRISVPFVTDESKARAVAERFIRDFYPTMQSFLPA